MVSSDQLLDQRGPLGSEQDETESVQVNGNPLSGCWFSDFILFA